MKNLWLLIATIFSCHAVQASLEINTSGSNGINGSNGYHAPNGSGGHGGDGGLSTPGGNAGDIDITLSDAGNGKIVISGTHPRTYWVNDGGQIILIANGGNGGRGGDGGNGGRGYTGTRGNDATRFSSGSNGGSGGRGGDGGNATSGSNGGNAGSITVRVKEKDMHLLYLVASPQILAGAGGAAGSNGMGGAGGYGGSGGNSYSWTESYQTTCTETCTETYTGTCTGTKSQSNGKGGSVTVSYSYSCTKTRTVSCTKPCTKTRSYSNPGGSSGASGWSGKSGSASVISGHNGSAGSYRYIVEYNDGHVEKYFTPFDIKITDWQMEHDFSDSFLQPGEKFRVKQITIQNWGGMPTPTLTPIRIRVTSDSANSINSDKFYDLMVSIPAGGKITINPQLNSEILKTAISGEASEANHHLGGPQKNIKLALSNEIIGINRFPNPWASSKNYLVRFPIAISRILGKRSIGQNDYYLFRWGVNNYSTHDYGSASSTKRQVRFISTFSMQSGAGSDAYYLEARGEDKKNKGIQELDAVNKSNGKPQESQLAWAKLGFTNNATLQDEGVLKVVVQIEDPYEKGKWITSDVAYFRVKVGNSFKMTKGSSILLVINPQTTTQEVAAWQQVATSLNRKMDIWDIGIMGALDIGSDKIAEHYSDGSIIVLNDLMKQPGSEALPADAMFKLVPSDFTKVAQENSNSFLIFDRTGSYKALAGGYAKFNQRDSGDPMLVAIKLNESKFKSADYIKSTENLNTVALTLSYFAKRQEFKRALRDQNSTAAQAYMNAIITDLAVEQIYNRSEDEVKKPLRFLKRLTGNGSLLEQPIDGSNPQELKQLAAEQLLELVARLRFLADSQSRWLPFQKDNNISQETNLLLNQILLESFNAKNGFWSASSKQKQAFKNVETILSKKIDLLNNETDKIADLFKTNDRSRFFTFPKKWAGDYFRQAAFSVILRPVYDRSYTSSLDLFNTVITKERLALPAFH